MPAEYPAVPSPGSWNAHPSVAACADGSIVTMYGSQPDSSMGESAAGR